MFSSLFGSNETKEPEWLIDDLPTPLSKEDYEKISNEALDNVIKVVSVDGWKLIGEKNGVLIEEMQVPGSDVNAIRTSCVLKNVNVHNVIKCIFEPSFAERRAIYDKLLSHELIEKVRPEIVVARSRFSAPLGVSPREFLMMRSLGQFDDGTYVISVRSINRKDVPFDPNYVRGISNSDIYIFPIDETRDVRIVSCDFIDPRGWIPTYIINSYKQDAGDWLIKMQEVYGDK